MPHYEACEGEFVDFATLDDWKARDEAKDATIARLTAALAEAEARGYARAVEDAAQYHERHAKGYAKVGARQDAAQHMQHAAAIRALAQKEAGE